MSEIDDLLTERAHAAAQDIDALLAQRAGGQSAPAPKAESLGKGERFGMGFMDLPTGLGQAAEHVAETPLNALRWTIRKGLQATGATEAAELFHPVSTSDFDQIVQKRESDYQQARANAQQTGIDWWRLGGNVANPINYLSGGAGAAETALGRIGQAAVQGAAVGAAQPSVTPGSFWWDKAKGAAIGGAMGGATAGVVEAVTPLLRMGTSAVRKALGADAAKGAAADATVNSALNAKGVDPASVDINVLKGLKQEAQDALEHGVEPSPVSIANRAKAESLPFPVRLMRGQASGEGMQFAREQNLRGIQGVGEPITNRLTEQNTAFINNLDALGARDAPDTVSTGSMLSERLQSFWDTLQQRKNQLYTSVRNSQGQPAMMDQFAATKQIRDALDTPQAMHAWDTLPGHIQKTIEDLEEGKLPLTVAQFEALDKAWGADARAADGTTAFAINTARRLLGNADIQDDVGQQARQAYFAARQAHAQQMALIDPKLPNGTPNPQFQPLLKAVVMDGKAPETLFKSGFLDAAPSQGARNLAFLSQLDPNSPELVGRTLMGEIKRLALNSGSDERGTVSQSVLRSWARDPVKSARMDALLPQPLVGTFRNLADVVEAAKTPPPASAVNTSNTGSAVVNAATSMIKNSALTQITKRLPIARDVAEGLAAANVQTEVQQALKPGVTLKSLMQATPAQAASRRALTRAVAPAAAAGAIEAQER